MVQVSPEMEQYYKGIMKRNFDLVCEILFSESYISHRYSSKQSRGFKTKFLVRGLPESFLRLCELNGTVLAWKITTFKLTIWEQIMSNN